MCIKCPRQGLVEGTLLSNDGLMVLVADLDAPPPLFPSPVPHPRHLHTHVPWRCALSFLDWQIEPSSEGGSAIAALISHVVSHHNFEGPSVLYLQPPTAGTRVLEEPNEEGRPWSVADAWRGQAV